jgi:phosphatidylinositol alpha-1,6-mannosyltransferase
MKIGLVAPEFPPATGGVQTYAWHTARELARLGHEVTVFTQPDSADAATGNPPFKIEPVLKLRRRHDRLITARKMDVWHAMNAPCAWLSLETGPVFITVHGNDFLAPYHSFARLDLPFSDRLDYWFGDLLTRRLVRRALPRAAHIFTNSRHTEQRFLRCHPRCAGKTSVAGVGLAEEDFAPHVMPRSPGPPRLVTITRLSEPRKNVAAVLEALAQLRATHDFHYTIAGDGELRPELEALSVRLGLADRVTFAGFVNRERKLALLCASDLFVLASTSTEKSYEGFGLVYLEANACGTPTLATRLGGAVEAIEEGVTGFFADSPTVGGLVPALARFLDGEITFTAEACTRFARRFSWRAVVEHCAAHYVQATILAQTPRAP